MTVSLTDTLCTACGLCCDGSLFADVELAGKREVARLESLGLDVEDSDGDHRGLLLLPCRALDGTRCKVYAHRPECCRTFECRLLQQARRGTVSVEQAQAAISGTLLRIAHVKALATALDPSDERVSLKERCLDALAAFDGSDSEAGMRRTRDELESEMEALEGTIRATFLEDSP
jgi:uncharacterized protein